MERLVKDLSQSNLIPQHFLESEIDSVKESLNSFMKLVPKYRSTLRVRPSYRESVRMLPGI